MFLCTLSMERKLTKALTLEWNVMPLGAFAPAFSSELNSSAAVRSPGDPVGVSCRYTSMPTLVLEDQRMFQYVDRS